MIVGVVGHVAVQVIPGLRLFLEAEGLIVLLGCAVQVPALAVPVEVSENYREVVAELVLVAVELAGEEAILYLL